MSVEELIERLSELSAHEEVWIADIPGGFHEIEAVGLEDGLPAIFAHVDFEDAAEG